MPLGPPANGASPYSSTSAFAGNSLLISFERLVERGWLDHARLAGLSGPTDKIEAEQVLQQKVPLLCEAANNFLARASGHARYKFDNFCEQNKWWLEDFVLFDALRSRFDRQSWNRWPQPLARREARAMDEIRGKLATELAIRRVIQFFFYEQWHSLRFYCAERSIRVVGDIAIFVDYDSADVWSRRELYRLREDLEPEVVSGVPPDAFSATGQRWGNPLYHWDAFRQQGYDWWKTPALGHSDLRIHSSRSFPWLRPILGDSRAASQQRFTVNGWMVPRTNFSTYCVSNSADCRLSPKTSA